MGRGKSGKVRSDKKLQTSYSYTFIPGLQERKRKKSPATLNGTLVSHSRAGIRHREGLLSRGYEEDARAVDGINNIMTTEIR